jgi:L-ascorbate metabolism protein UlaG (beta-lactamase superfamily)
LTFLGGEFMENLRILFIFILLISFAVSQSSDTDGILFTPISHATFVIQTEDKMIAVDPVGGAELFSEFPAADLILITDVHGDHMSKETVDGIKNEETVIVAPAAVVEELGEGEILNNGEKKTFSEVLTEAIPMYNLTEERQNFHKKGRGNGYVITLNNKRIYIAGDTEDIPELRQLYDIDYAFICMNLPYTMTVEQAASAVLEMKPKVVYPYHYRGKGGFSDIEKFKELVSVNKDIDVRFLKWYK